MTSTKGEHRAPATDSDSGSESIFEWLGSNTRLVGVAAVVVVLVAAGGWLYTRAQAGKELRAEQSLRRAEQSVVAGNVPLAQTDLEKLVSTYKGTSGANQGAMLLAQLHFDKGEYQKGVEILESSQAARRDFEAPVEAMLGDGYSQLGKPAEAAAHYRKAALATRFDRERDGFMAEAARSLLTANDSAAARQIWQDIARNPRSELAAEARLRVGELTVKSAPKS